MAAASVSRLIPPPDDEFSAVLAYISQLQLEDIDDLQSRSHGKARDTSTSDAPLSDEEFAMMLFAEEAQGLLSVTKDYIMGPAHSGRSLIEELAAMEEMARLDREMALALSEGREPPVRPIIDVPARPADTADDGPIGESSISRTREPLLPADASSTSDDYELPQEASSSDRMDATKEDTDSLISSHSSASVGATSMLSGKE
ncbi:hypothetical protein B0H21DRAFT_819309 [Amylocystis lapponica]|nr:hypothetical protein B0H21DRAFT_819309 [Amylocystis lapponica]